MFCAKCVTGVHFLLYVDFLKIEIYGMAKGNRLCMWLCAGSRYFVLIRSIHRHTDSYLILLLLLPFVALFVSYVICKRQYRQPYNQPCIITKHEYTNGLYVRSIFIQFFFFFFIFFCFFYIFKEKVRFEVMNSAKNMYSNCNNTITATLNKKK